MPDDSQRRRPDPVAVLALVVAAYGAAVATWAAMRDEERNRQTLALRLEPSPSFGQLRPGVDCLKRMDVQVTVLNTGRRALTVDEFRFVSSDGSRLTAGYARRRYGGRQYLEYVGAKLPQRLLDGEQLRLTFESLAARAWVYRLTKGRLVAVEAVAPGATVGRAPIASPGQSPNASGIPFVPRC